MSSAFVAFPMSAIYIRSLRRLSNKVLKASTFVGFLCRDEKITAVARRQMEQKLTARKSIRESERDRTIGASRDKHNIIRAVSFPLHLLV